jgi:hypothetical protein
MIKLETLAKVREELVTIGRNFDSVADEPPSCGCPAG